MSAFCYVIELLFSFFFVFVNFSNAHVCFVFRHVQFFVFANLINVIQVLLMYLNLRVYLIVFVFIGCMFVLWYFVLQVFFVFFNFSNVLQVHLNLRLYLFVFVFVVEVLFSFFIAIVNFRNVYWFTVIIKVSDWVERKLFSLAVFDGNLLTGGVHSSVALDRHIQLWQCIGSSLLTSDLLWASACSLQSFSHFPTTAIF